MMRKMNKIVDGYDPVFVADMLDLLGVKGVGAWGTKLQAVAEELDETFGPFEGQLVISFAAMFNGCRVCSVGHMYVANLHHFEETGELFVIDEREVYELQVLSDEELLAVAADRMAAPQYERARKLIARLHALKYGGEAIVNPEDELLAGAIAAWDLLTECSILSDIEDPAQIDPLTSIAKRKDLIERYQAARGRKPKG